MLFKTEEKQVTVGNDIIGKVELKSIKYISVAETEYIDEHLKKYEPLNVKVREYCDNTAKKLKLKSGDVLDSFYSNTTNNREVRAKLVENNAEEVQSILKTIQKVTDVTSTINAYTMLLFRTSEDIKPEVEKFTPLDLLISGKVLTINLLIEVNKFYACEFEGIEYEYATPVKGEVEENFT